MTRPLLADHAAIQGSDLSEGTCQMPDVFGRQAPDDNVVIRPATTSELWFQHHLTLYLSDCNPGLPAV